MGVVGAQRKSRRDHLAGEEEDRGPENSTEVAKPEGFRLDGG